eukprot:GFYU01002997.1.p1 GENE.GFYU01002997.1~~GFYU01002997.1.p1  ORF type:complete len:225 (-),score=74.11 GFYU01002997.1:111-785(-)
MCYPPVPEMTTPLNNDQSSPRSWDHTSGSESGHAHQNFSVTAKTSGMYTTTKDGKLNVTRPGEVDFRTVSDKKLRRAISNRESARRSRLRKKSFVEDMQTSNQRLQGEMNMLRQQMACLVAENNDLRAKQSRNQVTDNDIKELKSELCRLNSENVMMKRQLGFYEKYYSQSNIKTEMPPLPLPQPQPFEADVTAPIVDSDLFDASTTGYPLLRFDSDLNLDMNA